MDQQNIDDVAEDRRARPVSILLVEADPDEVALIQASFADATAFQIEHVQRLAEANHKLRDHSFDIVMLDLSLPDSHGLCTLTDLHCVDEQRPPIVVMTGPDDETMALRAMQHGAQDYVVKGQFEPHLTARILRSAIERHRMMQELDVAKRREHYLATHNSLTQLPNRYLFYDRLEQAIAQARRNEKMLAVLFLDLDDFKHVNDALGHSAGDLLLQAVAGRITATVRSSDTTAHLAGDEFTVILNGISRSLDAAKVVQNIGDALAAPLTIAGREVTISASIGVSVYPTDGDSAEVLLNNADTAMNQVKKEGRSGHRFYSPEANAKARTRITLENDLRHAIELDELTLHYQPKVDGSNGRVLGSEALLRWNNRERGLVAPNQFIPLAEETGLIRAIGNWVVAEACRQNRTWLDAGLPVLPISVNVSPKQFSNGNLAQTIERSLQAVDLPGSLLEVEITESCLMADVDAVIQTLIAIKALDVRVSLDDFGTGYSSLSVLKRLPLDILKIDRSFISECTTDVSNVMITSAIISLANNLGLDTVAEGVEDFEQMEFLVERNCNVMQGFLFSRPLEVDAFAAVLREPFIRVEKPD